MNMFVLWKTKEGKQELVTPPLANGTILPGVTRDSVSNKSHQKRNSDEKKILQLTRKWKEFDVTEREFTIQEVQFFSFSPSLCLTFNHR